MNYLLSFLGAACIAIMLVPNGQLTKSYDFYASTFIIHLVGLIVTTVIMWVKKEKFRLSNSIPLILYSGGLIGVGTTMFNNVAYGKITISAILALSLFAQAVTSLVIDHYGFFHMPVQKFTKGKLVGFLFTMSGIAFLLSGTGFVLLPIIMSLVTGITVVTSRSVNAELAQKSSIWASTWYNYFVGLITCGAIWVVAALLGKSSLSLSGGHPAWIYTGGLIGVVAVTILNVVTKKMSAFILTLIMFVGQLFTGVVIDFLLGVEISRTYLLGGVLTVAGLMFNLWMDHRRK